MRIIPVLPVTALAVLFLWAPLGLGDQVVLKNGGILHARLLQPSGAQSVEMEIEGGVVGLSRDAVERVIVTPGSGVEDPLVAPDIQASSAVLMEGVTGRIILERNSRERRPIASLTKLMTAVLILERGGLNDRVTISARAAATGGSTLGLKPAQRVPLRSLLLGLLVRSANDAAVAAAEHVSDTEEQFVREMNRKAGLLGLGDTHFANCHGLDHPDHYSTALDMARLSRYALAFPFLAACVKNREVAIPLRRSHRPKICKNSNKLLRYFWGADGIKTGYTEEAGRCLAGSASRGGHRLIAVLLNDDERWRDACELFEYGFEALWQEKIRHAMLPSRKERNREGPGG